MVGGRTPDVPSKGFFLNQFWSNFNQQKKATEKHRKSFPSTVDHVLSMLYNVLGIPSDAEADRDSSPPDDTRERLLYNP